MNLEANQAANAERRRFEMEKEELKNRYETIIADLQTRINDMQKAGSRSQSENISAVAAQYQGKLNAAEAKIASLEKDFAGLKTEADEAIKKSETMQKQLEYTNMLGTLYRDNLQYEVEQKGYAGLIVGSSDTSGILVYIDPVYGSVLENQKAFVYRQNYEHIADIEISGANGIFWGKILRLENAKQIKPNDMVLLDVSKGGYKNE